MKKIHAIEVKFLPITPTRYNNRVKLQNLYNESKVIINYPDTASNTLEVAKDYLLKNGFEILGYIELKNSYLITINEEVKRLL